MNKDFVSTIRRSVTKSAENTWDLVIKTLTVPEFEFNDAKPEHGKILHSDNIEEFIELRQQQIERK